MVSTKFAQVLVKKKKKYFYFYDFIFLMLVQRDTPADDLLNPKKPVQI